MPWPLGMEWQINNENSRASPTQTWIPLKQLVATYNFTASLFWALHCTVSIYDHFTPWQLVAVPKLQFLGKDCWHQMTRTASKEQVLNLATTPVIMAPVRLARLLWWLPRRAKQSLYGDWCRTWNKCHWSWNVRSAMRKVILKKILDPLRTADDYLQVYSFLGSAQSLFGTNSDHGSW